MPVQLPPISPYPLRSFRNLEWIPRENAVRVYSKTPHANSPFLYHRQSVVKVSGDPCNPISHKRSAKRRPPTSFTSDTGSTDQQSELAPHVRKRTRNQTSAAYSISVPLEQTRYRTRYYQPVRSRHDPCRRHTGNGLYQHFRDCGKNFSADWALEHPELLPPAYRQRERNHPTAEDAFKIRILDQRIRQKRRAVKNKKPVEHAAKPVVPQRVRVPVQSRHKEDFPKSTPPPRIMSSSSVGSIKDLDIPDTPREEGPKPILSSLFEKEDPAKVETYQNLVGELKDAIKRATSRDAGGVLRPSDIVRESNRRIPPVIPPPPVGYDFAPEVAPLLLRHVSPPESPRMGRVLEHQAEVGQSQANRRVKYSHDIHLVDAHDENAWNTTSLRGQLERLTMYERQLIENLPSAFDIGDNDRHFVANDGTEWEVIVLKPADSLDETLRSLLPEDEGDPQIEGFVMKQDDERNGMVKITS